MPTLVGHRGAPRERTENTVASLELAQRLGAQAVEFDVRGTADGHPVLLHDRTLERFWGDPRTPGELTLAQVRQLRHTAGTGERVPTLAEVVEAVGVRLVVDGKDPDLVPATVAVLRAGGALDRSCFIGEPEVLAVVRGHLPAAEIILSWSGAVPPPASLLDTIRPQALNLPWAELSDAAARTVTELGYQLWTYCVDDADGAARALRLGVRGVITNDIPAVAPALAAPTAR